MSQTKITSFFKRNNDPSQHRPQNGRSEHRPMSPGSQIALSTKLFSTTLKSLILNDNVLISLKNQFPSRITHLEHVNSFLRAFERSSSLPDLFSRYISKSKLPKSVIFSSFQSILDLFNRTTSYTLPFFRQHQDDIVEFTRDQISSLVAFMLIRSISQAEIGYTTSRGIKNRVQQFHVDSIWNSSSTSSVCKLDGWISYFHVLTQTPTSFQVPIIYERHSGELFSVDSIKTLLGIKGSPVPSVLIHNSGSMFEDNHEDSAMIDFANKYIGGGVLRHGMVQEEIMMTEIPCLLPLCLLFEMLTDTEVAVARLAFRTCKTSGYSSSTTFDCLVSPPVSRTVVAMDAVHYPFKGCPEQFTPEYLMRDLSKIITGYKAARSNPNFTINRINTGHFGCGAFNGCKERVFVLQFIAAYLCCISFLDYYAFGEEEFSRKARCLFELVAGGVIVFDFVFDQLLAYHTFIFTKRKCSIIDFIFWRWFLSCS
ncbi:hypothetical protein RCL1_004289 [Eukaryota sp. TZLM3-RCL]